MDQSTTKIKIYLSLLIAPLLLFFEPYSILVKAIGVLVVIDVISGVLAAKKEGKDLTSKSTGCSQRSKPSVRRVWDCSSSSRKAFLCFIWCV